MDTGTNTVSFLSPIDSTNLGGLTKSGSGSLVLSSSNGYTGTTTISSGTLQANQANALGNGNITFTGGKLQYTSASAGTDWSARIVNSTSPASIDTGTNTVSFLSPIDSTNLGGLTKSGSGTLILAGTSGFTGLTTLSVGTLQIGNGTTDGSIGSSSKVSTGWFTTLAFNVIGNQTYAGAISGNGTLTKSGSGTLTLSGSNSYGLGTFNNFGVINVQSDYAFGPGTITNVTYNSELQFQGGVTVDSSRFYSISNNGIGAPGVVAFRNVSGTNTIQGAITVTVGGGGFSAQSDSGLLVFTGSMGTNQTNRSLYFQGAADGIYSGNITDASRGATLTKNGGGTWTFSGSNSYTGITTINGGTLVADNANALGTGTANIVFGGSGALCYTANSAATDWSARFKNSSGSIAIDTNGQNVSLANAIDNSNTGGLKKGGAGILALSGSNSYGGGTTVNNGVLQVGSANALGTGGLTVNGGTLDLNGKSVSVPAFAGAGGAITNAASGASTFTAAIAGGTSTYAGAIVDGLGSVTLTKNGAGTLILSGSLAMAGFNASGGVTEIAQSGTIGLIAVSGSGTVALTANGANSAKVIDSSSLSIAAGGTLDMWDNALILRDQTSGSNQGANLAMVQGLVNTAFDNGNWDKPGITSSTVIADLSAYSVLTVMVYDNTVLGIDSFEGISNLSTDNGGNQVMLKTTYLGDFDGNGIVNSADYGWLDFYYGYGLTVGDLNGDGQVNSADYNGIDYGYGYQAYGVLAARPGGSVQTANADVSTPEAVPEPCVVPALISGLLSVYAMRRSRTKRS